MTKRKRLNRRDFLKVAGGAAAGSAILAACGPTPTPEVIEKVVTTEVQVEVTKEVPVEVTRVVEVEKEAPTPAPVGMLSPPTSSEGPDLEFRSWAWGVEVVQENLEVFIEDYDEHVHYSVISGDYGAVLGTQLMTAVPLDMVYGSISLVFKFAKAGWIHDYERYWKVDEIKDVLYPNVREAMTVDGKLYGLPYFTTAQGAILSNELVLEEAGMKGEYPATWDELYDQCRKIKQTGAAEYPFLPKWNQSEVGIHAMFITEAYNRGIDLWDENQHPVFDGNSDAVGMVENWHSLYVDKICPEANLTMQDSDIIDAFARGGYAYSMWQLYECRTWNDPTVSNIPGHCRVVPYQGQPWGKLEIGMYFVPNTHWKTIPDEDKDHHLARAYRLAGFFGYKDKRGDFFVTKKFAINHALGSGYDAIWDDPEVQAAFAAWVPDEQVIEDYKGVLASTSFPAVERTAWYTDWSYAVKPVLAQAVIGEVSAKDAVVKCREEADKLIEMYAA